MNIALYACAGVLGATYGTRGEKGAQRQGRWLSILRSPLFLSVILGVVLHFFLGPGHRPNDAISAAMIQMVGKCLVYLGQATSGLVLIALGVALRPSAFRAYAWPVMAACALKLVVAPVAMWMFARMAGYSGELLALGILQAGMPSAVMGSVLCGETGMVEDYAVSAVFVSTILSVITLPILLAALR
jgi:hypothetical protein